MPQQLPNNATAYLRLTKEEEKKLRGTPADPDEAIMVKIYSDKTKKFRNQNMKRRKLIDKLVMYTDFMGQRQVGKCVGFYTETGDAVIMTKNDSPPHEKNPDLTFVF